MPFRSRNIVRETATAIAVMAVYLLVLLAPLHQAAGLQRDLAKLGYASSDTWSLCSALAKQSDDDQRPSIAKCAVSGLGKNELAGIVPVAPDLSPVLRTATVVRFEGLSLSPVSKLELSSAQPRAPPVA